MEFPGLGTLINVVTIIGGAAFGVLIGSRVSEKLRDLVTDILVWSRYWLPLVP